MKKILKNNYKYIFSFIVLLVISYFFPCTADDYYWGSKSLSIDEFISISHDTYLNGRYLGDLFAIIMLKYKVIRCLILSLVINFIVYLISKNERINSFIVWLFLLLMCPLIMAQSVIWTSGFVNYGLSTLLVIYLYYEKDNILNKGSGWYHFWHILLVFIGEFLLENVSIFTLIYFIYLNISSFVKNKRVNKHLIIYLAAAILGFILMFMHPSYLSSFGIYGNGYKKISYRFSEIFERILINYGKVCYYLLILSFVYSLALTILLFIDDKKKNRKRNILHIYNFMFCLYSVISSLFGLEFEVVNIVLGTIFIFSIFYLLYKFYKKDKDIWEVVIMIILIILPLMIVEPVGARHFFIINILEIVLICKIIFKEKLLRDSNSLIVRYLKLVLIFLCFYLSFVYIYIGILDIKRNSYIKKEIDNGSVMIVVKKFPFLDYVWWSSSIGTEYFGYYYNLYLGYDENIRYVVE